ncbi:MAG: alcohol dehydrogenase catalytic domain-containing protein [Chloroflexi bacterium]|nr:alcohol dehydrogenase catalytic domain-containing protein [Chloroflexota bacterium]
MATMKAAMYYGKGDIRVEEVPKPVPAPGEVLVRVRYCGICGSDLRSYQRGSPPGNLPVPRILGHEFAGEVAEVGAAVEGFQIGERVAAAPATACGECFYCQRGSPTLCLNALDFGTTHNGAQAEYVLIPAQLVAQGGLVKLPEEISYERASLLEPVGTCVRGLHTQGKLQRGETVVVIGDGALGLIQVALASHFGAGTVICAGHHEERLVQARQWGAQITVNTHDEPLLPVVREATDGMGADLVMVSVPNAQALQEGLPLVRGGGRLLVFGGVPRGSTVPIEPNLIHYGELHVLGTFNCTVEEFRAAVEIARGLPLEKLVTHRVPLEQILDGYQLMAGKAALRVLVDMGDEK